MKEQLSQGPYGTDPYAFPSLPFLSERTSPPAKGSGNSLLLLQLRTELEGKWRPDKLGILRRWINVSPKQWFCQKEDVHGYSSRPINQSGQKQSRKKQKGRNPSSSKTPLADRVLRPGENVEEVSSEKNHRRVRRFLLEEEIMILQNRLQGELDLHMALESFASPSCRAWPRLPEDLPLSTFELIKDITVLEEAVADLEDQSATLESLIGKARMERESLEEKKNVSKCCYDHSLDSSVNDVPDYSSSLPDARRSKISFGAEESFATSISCAVSGSPRTLGDYLSQLSVVRAADTGNADLSVHSEGSSTPIVQQASKSRSKESSGGRSPLAAIVGRSLLSWKSSKTLDAFSQESCGGMSSSESVSKHSFLSAFDPHNRVQSSAALLQDTPIPMSFSPARYLYSGASTSEQSGSCGHSGSSVLQGSSDYSLPASPAVTPEHRVRTTSPTASATVAAFSGRENTNNHEVSEETYSKYVPRGFLPAHEDRSSSVWSFASEEFHTPRTSSSFGDHLSGDSQPSSAEKRISARVKLKVQADDCLNSSLNFDKSCDAGNATSRSLMCDMLSPRKQFGIPRTCSPCGVDNKRQSGDLSQTPNLLSEEMIKCMISIYCHLADPAVILRNRSCYDTIPSPTSHFGHAALSSFSSFSESSLLSFVRSPLVDLRSKDDILGHESSPDPFKVRGRIPWADIGMYSKVLEVPWMSVSKDQLGYAAQALHKFRQLVEQLPCVDPRCMSHSEKLAFWLNLYNSLMMHAYLAYGIPRNDLKYFALTQKAAYNVGGHSFSAATIEFSLLQGKTPSYRPQIGLLFALHRSKSFLTEEQRNFAIDYPEPLMAFALCCGAHSSPAVRVYSGGQVHEELNLALQDYARAAVGLNTKGKLLVPKLLYTYACEMVDDGALLAWICQLLPVNQAGLVLECWQHRQARLLGARKFAVLPFELNFRYLFAPFQTLW